MKAYLTRLYRFSAAHRLHSPALTDEENRAAYGKCNNPHGHGHDYEVELTVSGEVSRTTGRVMELGALDRLAQQAFLSPLGWKNLNSELPGVPTTENLACDVLERLRRIWPPQAARLETIRIRETERNICEIANL